eukprot:Lankesteria_metandrocarpae@DN3046_c0_g1_i1.p1
MVEGDISDTAVSTVPHDRLPASLSDFFPATRADFKTLAGEVKSVTAADFEDAYRQRHLESFQTSMREWTENFNIANEASIIATPLVLEDFVLTLAEATPNNLSDFLAAMKSCRKQFHIAPSKRVILDTYTRLRAEGRIQMDDSLSDFLVKRSVRSHSGVVVITVLTSPGAFSCPKDCHYCPNEPGQPRSYLSTEPAVLRANQNGWDAALQFWDRASTLRRNGHTIDKIEILVLGGTWSGYPESYQESFIRDLFYAANTFVEHYRDHEDPAHRNTTAQSPTTAAGSVSPDVNTKVVSCSMEGDRTPVAGRDDRKLFRSARLTLEEEQKINEKCDSRIIGVTLETRPDFINKPELRRLRSFGCTRVQLGIQHTDDEILNIINRGCTRAQCVKAIKLLKDSGFKVDIHIMPDLPGTDPVKDREMFEYILSSSDLQVDQWKIYPCEVTPFSKIESWYKEGNYKPYAELDKGLHLVKLILHVKAAVHPWIRLNRVVRDIPNQSIIGGNDMTNLRQVLVDVMNRNCLVCRCIRCREVKGNMSDTLVPKLKIRGYNTIGGAEYFISYEAVPPGVCDDAAIMFAFLRLRLRDDVLLPNNTLLADASAVKHHTVTPFPELRDAALVRELHVYGVLVAHNEYKRRNDTRPQHTGIGRSLLAVAEFLALKLSSASSMAVISGVGAKEYYRKCGYAAAGTYMSKAIHRDTAGMQCLVDEMVRLNIPSPLNIERWSTCTDLESQTANSEVDNNILSMLGNFKNPIGFSAGNHTNWQPTQSATAVRIAEDAKDSGSTKRRRKEERKVKNETGTRILGPVQKSHCVEVTQIDYEDRVAGEDLHPQVGDDNVWTTNGGGSESCKDVAKCHDGRQRSRHDLRLCHDLVLRNLLWYSPLCKSFVHSTTNNYN